MFRISKKTPITTNLHRPRSDRNKYRTTLEKLEIGDSFFVKSDLLETMTVRSASYQYGKRHSKKFVTSIVKNGVRVWRTA